MYAGEVEMNWIHEGFGENYGGNGAMHAGTAMSGKQTFIRHTVLHVIAATAPMHLTPIKFVFYPALLVQVLA